MQGAFVPKDISKGTYDASGADLSLANKCAFLTGNDCVRMERLLRMSDLTREKWNREDDMRGTNLKACKATTDWYNYGKGVTQGAAVPEANATGGIVLDDFRYYAPDSTFIFVPQREMWSKDGVDNNVKPWPNGYRPTIWLAQAQQSPSNDLGAGTSADNSRSDVRQRHLDRSPAILFSAYTSRRRSRGRCLRPGPGSNTWRGYTRTKPSEIT